MFTTGAVGQSWRTGAFDVQAVCSGFVYALVTADKFINCAAKGVLVALCGRLFNEFRLACDHGTGILFGDGAGTQILEASDTAGIFRPSCTRTAIKIFYVPAWRAKSDSWQ
ncbi:MAG: hypothetical protein R3E08_08550 [Thiotrichaceae bacterium]